MKQVLQNLRDGTAEVAEVPTPCVAPGHVVIRTSHSLISAGTERMLVEFGKANLIDKARQQPDKVRQVLDKVRTDGLVPTLNAVRAKFDQPLALGYCNAGTVIEVGSGVTGFAPGDRVVSNGKHAEVVSVPMNLCAKIPCTVSDESAAFTIVGAIALQGIRLVQPALGEAVVVTGLGLIGLMTVQLLRSHGCRVLGLDYDAQKLELAQRFGAETVDLSASADPMAAAQRFSRARGVDAVIVTAATKSSEPMHQAALMCRKRGRIVLVGVTGLELSRADFYEKELTFQVSCSYGPGRYDPGYEDKGQDYPIGFVRWTEQRNFEAVLDMMAVGSLDMHSLVTHRFPIEAAAKAYDLLASSEKSLGILLSYPQTDVAPAEHRRESRVVLPLASTVARGKAVAGFIGAGNYGGRVLLKAFKEAGATLHTVVSASGVSASHYGRKFGCHYAGSEPKTVIDDPEIDIICIATRHSSHARFVHDALRAGKNVFVEKPLCLTIDELATIASDLRETAQKDPLLLSVGFNRRFAPMVIKMKALLAGLDEPKSLVMTINAGAIPNDHWTQDPEVGGGRIVGEACHFIDLMRHLVGAPIDYFTIASLPLPGGPVRPDTASLTLRFSDGSCGVINYFANGHRAAPKERLEVYCGGRVLVLDNFRRLAAYGWRGFSGMRSWTQDKGQKACVAAFVDAVRSGGPAPIPVDEILEVSRVAIEAAAR